MKPPGKPGEKPGKKGRDNSLTKRTKRGSSPKGSRREWSRTIKEGEGKSKTVSDTGALVLSRVRWVPYDSADSETD